MKYILYARKSSESEEKQIQSIDDQINYLKKIANDSGIKISRIMEESRSAKKPGRPVFNEMVSLLSEGKADAILCWKIDRLSRNPIDSGTIQWLLQNSMIKEIATAEKKYRPQDNTLLFSVESGMANQYLLDLSKNVKRGMKSKVEKGWMPNAAPVGYLNTRLKERGKNTIIEDEQRFELVKNLWLLLLKGSPVKEILRKANSWGLTLPQFGKRPEGQLTRSTLYRIFKNKFYAGYFRYNGDYYKGKHRPMITLEEYERAQILLKRKDKDKPIKKIFSYTGIIKCGNCGGMITASKKSKFVKLDKSLHYYTYYHCSKRKKGVECKEKSIKEYQLEEIILNLLDKVNIVAELKDWALEIIDEQFSDQFKKFEAIKNNKELAIKNYQSKLTNLLELRLNETITDDEYIENKERLKKKIEELSVKNDDHLERLETLKNAFKSTCNLKPIFIASGPEKRKLMLKNLLKEAYLMDGEIKLELEEMYEPIHSFNRNFDSRLELSQKRLHNAKKDPNDPLSLLWRTGRDSNPRPPP